MYKLCTDNHAKFDIALIIELSILYFVYVMKPFLYGRDSLFSIRKSVINTSINTIEPPLWNKLKELKIAKQTRRGCRSGRNKQRQIKVQISTRLATDSATSFHSPRKIGHQNLIEIPVRDLKEPCTQRTKFACWNSIN